MAVAINAADKSLSVVIELLLWMQRSNDVWLLQMRCGQMRVSNTTPAQRAVSLIHATSMFDDACRFNPNSVS
jgi:hypothetical protein